MDIVFIIRILLGLSGFMVATLGGSLIAVSVFFYSSKLSIVVSLVLGIVMLSCGIIMASVGVVGLNALQLSGR